MSRAKSLLCLTYAAIAVIAFFATWSQNLAYFGNGAFDPGAFGAFIDGTKATPASRSITVDIGLFFLAAAIFMLIEAKKHAIRFVWLYIVLGLFVAISVTFPLFLIAREMRLTDQPSIRTLDIVPLLAFTALILGLTVYVDLM